MVTTQFLLCDGCGQPASPEHTARRLRLLEWATRWRPIHINTLLLSAFSPHEETDFLYSGEFHGEARLIMDAAGIAYADKSSQAALAEFQRAGLFLSYALECPLDAKEPGDSATLELLSKRVGPVVTRIRRSLKPKRVVLLSTALAPVAERLANQEMGCPVLWDEGKPFDLEGAGGEAAAERLRKVTGVTAVGA
jgi:hypothetical protein